MQIIIIILLVIIIVILCPSIFGVAIIAISALISMLIKMAIPLSVLTLLLIILSIVNKKTKKKSLFIRRLIVYISIIFSLIIAIILNISEAFFLSYLVIFSTLIFYIFKCNESNDSKTQNILIGLLFLIWGIIIGLEDGLLFSSDINTYREIPSVVTLVLINIPFALPFGLIPYLFPRFSGRYIKDLTYLNNIKFDILIMMLIIIGIINGVIISKYLQIILNMVHESLSLI